MVAGETRDGCEPKAPLAGKSIFACYHDADYLSTVKPNPHIPPF
jgi:hypothetical protein